VAPTVLWELGATVVPIGVSPDGFNINRGCGSTAPEYLCAHVIEHGAHLGIALDGDADRLLMADEKGELIDGDQILALIAQSWANSGRLRGNGIVATVMSNLGLERHLADHGLAMHRTKVGDRYVAERMREAGMNLGGEQSGHVILSDFATTGDGLLAALQVLSVIVEQRRSAGEVCRVFTPLPMHNRRIKQAIAAAEADLNGSGRLLIRESGTEPLLRVMAEAEDEALVRRVVGELCDAIAAVTREREDAD
jgi:phosphoglucosamine mutase